VTKNVDIAYTYHCDENIDPEDCIEIQWDGWMSANKEYTYICMVSEMSQYH